MKSKILLLLIFIFCGSVCGQNNQEIFLQANQMYKQYEVEKALQLYDSIINKGAAVWYNMGNCYYEQEKFLDALVCWRRAQQQCQLNVYNAAQENIDMLASKLGYQESRSIFDRIKKITVHGSLFMWQLLFLAAWFLLFALFKYKRRLLVLAANSCLVMLLALVLAIKHSDITGRYGIINDDVALFIGPGEHFSIQSKLSKMHEVVITKEADAWYNVAYSGGSGWIPVGKVSLIN